MNHAPLLHDVTDPKRTKAGPPIESNPSEHCIDSLAQSPYCPTAGHGVTTPRTANSVVARELNYLPHATATRCCSFLTFLRHGGNSELRDKLSLENERKVRNLA
jgi:hypothetical protein